MNKWFISFLFLLPTLVGEGSSWTAPVDLSVDGANSIDPKVAVNDSGQVVAVWVRGQIAKGATGTFEGSWSTPDTLRSGLTETAFTPCVNINALGEILAVWGGE